MSSYTRGLWLLRVSEALATPFNQRTPEQQAAVEIVTRTPTARESVPVAANAEVSLARRSR